MTINSTRMILAVTAKALDVALPKTLTDTVTDADALLERANSLSSERTHPDLTDAVNVALRKGEDPLDSAVVQRAALAYQIANSGVGLAVTTASDGVIRSALVATTDEILSAWSRSLEPHAENLLTAAEKLGIDNLHERSAIERAPVAYSQAVDAIRRFAAAVNGAQQLALRCTACRPPKRRCSSSTIRRNCPR